MSDDTLSKLIAIRKTGKAIVNAHTDNVLHIYNGNLFTLYDISLTSMGVIVSLIINDKIEDFKPGEVSAFN